VLRLTSGEATAEDAAMLRQWRAKSADHRKAFAEANLLWNEVGVAVAESVQRNPISYQAMAADRYALPRRAVLGGGMAALAAVAGYVVLRPPLGIWPSLTDLTADYSTGIGQQKEIAFDGDVQVKLNTRTSVSVLSPDIRQSERIELLSGEAAVTAAPGSERTFVVVAGRGQTIARNARLNIRRDDMRVCVTCLEGEIRVEHHGRETTLAAREQVIYTDGTLGGATTIDPEAVTAWERGLLVFRNEPLSRVIDEVNRYRAGKIILLNEELGRRTVVATFRIDRIEEVVQRLRDVLGVRTRTLPGGIVVVS
jgi:transmembrane sensor